MLYAQSYFKCSVTLGDQACQMNIIASDRLSHFIHVAVPIVDGRNATDSSRHMVEQFFGDVDRRAKAGERRRERPPQIVQRVGLDGSQFRVEALLGLAPSVEDRRFRTSRGKQPVIEPRAFS